ncbi:MAG: histidine kinase dimerization/phospho-acceptor domain-containing protein [Chloroflexota bacterium]
MNNTKIVVISKNDELVRLVEKVADYAVEHLSSYSAYENYYATILLHDVDTVIIEPKSLAELSKSSCLVYALTNQAIIPKNLELYTDIWTDWQNAGLLKKHLSSATQILILYEIKQFSIGVGHEMSAPLNSIQGYVELTTVIDVSEEQIASFLDIIRSNAQYIGHLIYDYRDWVAYKESTLIIIREPFILSDLIQK